MRPGDSTIVKIEEIVLRSFQWDGSRSTRAEHNRRVEKCVVLWDRLVKQAGWTNQKFLDHLPRYLRCELDGQPYSMPNGGMWAPEALNRLPGQKEL